MITRSLFRAMCKAQAKGEYHRTKKFIWRYEFIETMFPYYIVAKWPVNKSNPPSNIFDWYCECELDALVFGSIEKKYFKDGV